ncbi:hypothetical protein BGZ60DRAFT_534997 [Tricladium varicosporioides]|nr:hypothetical protein BGZ60DRAFT_534997 [Hymenoscyphus varicosporioides]
MRFFNLKPKKSDSSSSNKESKSKSKSKRRSMQPEPSTTQRQHSEASRRPRPQSVPLFSSSSRGGSLNWPTPVGRDPIQYGQSQSRSPVEEVEPIVVRFNYDQPAAVHSSSNLSTTSTLLPENLPKRNSAHSNADSYEAFLSRAREEERRRDARRAQEEQMVRAWIAAEQRRVADVQRRNPWPADPWRGGFGPSVNEAKGDPVGWRRKKADRNVREGGNVKGFGIGVKGWLGQNGLLSG